MTNLQEAHVDLLIALMDPETKSISTEDLQDDQAVQELIKALGQDLALQTHFVLKCNPEAVAMLCRNDRFPEEGLVHIFNYTSFPLDRIVDILRALDFDFRHTTMEGLRALDYPDYSTLEKRMDSRYGVIEGVFFKDISEAVSDQSADQLVNQCLHHLDKPELPLTPYKAYITMLHRTLPLERQVMTEALVRHAQLLKDTTPIKSKGQFVFLVKWAYLIGFDADHFERYKPYCQQVIVRILKTLMQYQQPEKGISILEQLPEPIVAHTVETLQKMARSKSAQRRNAAILIKNAIEKGVNAKTLPKIQKAIRRYKLAIID